MTSLFSAPPQTETPDLTPLRRQNSATRIRPAGNDDVPFLWQLFGDDEISYRWIFRGRTPTLETVRTNLNRPNIIPYIAEDVTTGEPFGYLVAYDINYSNGHTHLGVVIDARHAGSGVGVNAAVLFADYLFAVLPLRKLYLRSIEYSFAQYRALLDRGYAEIEGVLREHEYFGGRYWDVFLLVVDRGNFFRLREKVGQR
ncbi:RimJ/RimL family protein N-acetyltransferase [Amycolatopsis bartoniae]|uniref:N-acetyltransferase domain-containing protein n=1 Tax=Amycolatopsis bartoniae TaxID=941986 RepID=A0A8H9IXS5_9PSEU|nr:GNAT family protein [Amycolatopsis bartoniae]MBB2939482.1 RimJ/RimL family protein N-acetyltransferase [Amycolatopsis bartoniae]TVT11315.1 GNAT family N-acetyltransferase [Amycolatopsis bartoniae]GHF66564.1 hypothetical protein GCM10017566_45460 [Amycolatopsis bartoniae]